MTSKHYIIRLSGGLGNQMFQYAFGLALERRGARVEYDLSGFDARRHRGETPRDFELQRVFNVPLSLAEGQRVELWSDMNPNLFSRLRRRIAGRKRTHICKHDFGGFDFHPEVWNIPYGYLEGYWQNLAYLSGVEDDIRQAFTFLPTSDSSHAQWLNSVEETESVAVHIRRGDYLLNPGIHHPLPVGYYCAAIKKMYSVIENPTFFVFSDDLTWAKANLPLPDAKFVNGNFGETAFRDMHLISRCRHAIIANSSFGWWGAFLNPHPRKQVIVPADYATPGQLAVEEWIRLQERKDYVL